jgi:DNA-binding NarL/FixJ family response regulator
VQTALAILKVTTADGRNTNNSSCTQQGGCVNHLTPGEQTPTTQACEQIGLTERQAQVLARIAQGKPNKVICRELNLAVGTVKIHVSAVLKALKVSNRTQAAIAARALSRNAWAPAINFGHIDDPACGCPENPG